MRPCAGVFVFQCVIKSEKGLGDKVQAFQCEIAVLFQVAKTVIQIVLVKCSRIPCLQIEYCLR